MSEPERPGEAWRRRMAEEEPAAREQWPTGGYVDPAHAHDADANPFYADLLAGSDESHPDPMAGSREPDDSSPPTGRLPSPDEMFAQHLGVTFEEFIEVFGLGWQEVAVPPHFLLDPMDFDGLVDDDHGTWHITGEPPQLMMRVAGRGIEVAVPRGEWRSPNALVLVPVNIAALADTCVLDASTPHVLNELLRKRRSTFRYCRYCRSLTPPEMREARNVCYPCAEMLHPRVY